MTDLNIIINEGFCIGCGLCTYVTRGTVPISLNTLGMYQVDLGRAVTLAAKANEKILQVCPFSNEGLNEDLIGQKLFEGHCSYDSRIGYYKDLYIGYALEGEFRKKGTSGGVITWLLTELMKSGEIDAVAHVQKVDAPEDGVLFRYGISRSIEEVKRGAKSRYYPIEMSRVLEHIRKTPGRYAVVGLPCFIKAVRQLSEIDPIIKERVTYCIGLVCGHLKSTGLSECFAWQSNIEPGQLEEIDFRVKLEDRAASHYGVYMRGGGREEMKPVRGFMGGNWGHNLFRYPACDFCDDVFSETADISVGDAWLPQYEQDSKGSSVIVLRNIELSQLIKSAIEMGGVAFDESSAEKIGQSQAGGLRDRREGLAYRLWMKQSAQEWSPTKRIAPCRKGVSSQRQKLYRLRFKMGRESHQAWQKAKCDGNMDIFTSFFNKANVKYKKAYFTLRQRVKYSLSLVILRFAKKFSNYSAKKQ